jgi:hypothetical protein
MMEFRAVVELVSRFLTKPIVFSATFDPADVVLTSTFSLRPVVAGTSTFDFSKPSE